MGEAKRSFKNFGPLALGFLISALLMKLLSEGIHEVLGHGFFVLLFGGQIIYIHLSLLWPYVLSGILWWLPPNLYAVQLALVYAGGILACGFVSYVIQAGLLWKKLQWPLSLPLFWLSFWCYTNAVGYLIIGGLFPFGDIATLITIGFMTSNLALIIGFILFLVGFFFLSTILRQILMPFLFQQTRWAIVAFWLIIPVLVILAITGLGIEYSLALPISFLPIFLSYLLEFYIASRHNKQKTHIIH